MYSKTSEEDEFKSTPSVVDVSNNYSYRPTYYTYIYIVIHICKDVTKNKHKTDYNYFYQSSV